MDYDARLVEFCPSAYVQQARQEDLKQYPQNRVITTAWGQSGDGRADCIDALIAYFTPKIDANTHPQQLRAWLGYLSGYNGRMPADLALDVRAALLRIPYDPDLAETYFMPLIAHKIDVSAELATRIVPDWTFARLKTREAHTWYYFRYLASLGSAEAYAALADKVAMTADGNVVYSMLENLRDLRTPEAREILTRYVDDSRDLVGPSGDRTPLTVMVPLLIDLANWN